MRLNIKETPEFKTSNLDESIVSEEIVNSGNYNDAQKEYSNSIDAQTKDYMDFMMQNGVINQSFIEGTFLGDDIAYCNEIRSAIEITLSESKKQQ